MNSGQLRTQIKIQADTVTRNQYGEVISGWATIHTIQAKKRAINGLKNEIGDSITSENKTEFYIRYIPNLSTKMRIIESQKFGGVTYSDLVYRIESIADTSGKKRELKVVCKIFK